MANCNCNDFPISCAPHAPGGDCCHPHGCPPHPCPPPPFKGGTSMYIGARYVPIFADPVEWDNEREYEPLTIVVHNGDCYTSKCYVPKGAQLPPYPEGQTKYWVKTSDYNYQFADLKKTVTDLSRLVEQFQKDNERFTELINGWNEKVIQWEKDMAAWGERLDAVESNVADLTDSLNAEIDRAKAAEQANADAIAQETADRKQAISDLDAAYKAADAAEAQARAEADTALSNRITTNKTDIDAIKAEQVIQNTNISANAKNISDNAAEIAKHAARLTDLESNASDWDSAFPDTTIAQEVQNEEAARANGDTALNGRCDAIAADVEEVRDIANHKVDQTVFNAADNMNVKYSAADRSGINIAETVATTTAPKVTRNWLNSNFSITSYNGIRNLFARTSLAPLALKSEVDTAQAAADKANANIGDWETDHPGQTISQCVTSQETELEEHAGDIARLEADKADKSEIPDVSGLLPKAEAEETYQPKGEYALKSEIPDVLNFVTNTVYNEGQQAQDAKIDANTAALAGKADKGEIPDVSGFVTTQTYTQGQAAQDAKIDANTAALANKADKGEIPDVSGLLSKTEAEETYQPKGEYALKSEIPDVSGLLPKTEAAETYQPKGEYALKSEIPDVSGLLPKTEAAETYQPKGEYALKSEIPDVLNFVTNTVYNEGQQAQDAKIDEAKAAADKATISIGDWDAQHPGQTIAQTVTDVSGSIPDVSEFVTNAKRGEVFPIFLNMHTASDYYLPIGTFNGSTIVFLIPTSKFFQDRTLLNLCDRYGTKQEGHPYTYSINKSDGVIYTDTTVDNGYYLRPLGTAALLEIFPSLSTAQKLKPGEPITLRELEMDDTQLFISVENITEPES